MKFKLLSDTAQGNFYFYFFVYLFFFFGGGGERMTWDCT